MTPTTAKSQSKKDWRVDSKAPVTHWLRDWKLWTLLLAIIFVAGVRYRLRDIPIERDEGEYAYQGQLMLDGIPPYQLAYNMKLPGTYAAYAVIMAVFGETAAGIHTGLLILNAGTTLLLFLLARKLFGPEIGTVSAITYAVLSASASVYGLAGHATHFVVAAAVAGILLLIYALESDRLALFFFSGTLFGLAYLMKQPGAVFSIFGLLYLAYRKRERLLDWHYSLSRIGLFAAGIAWPFGLTCLVLYRAGVFGTFWFWTFDYARTYATSLPLRNARMMLLSTFRDMFRQDGPLWFVTMCGIPPLFLNRGLRSQRMFVVGLLIFSFAGVSAGSYFRGHYFIMLLPVASLLCGVAVVTASRALQHKQLKAAAIAIPAAVYAAAVLFSVFQQAPFFFAPNPQTACERRYYNDPNLEAKQIGEYLKTHASPNERLAIFGSEPEIYFYSHLRSATGYIYTYGLMEEQEFATRMQDQMLQEVAASHPEYVLFVDDRWSWLWHPGEARRNFFVKMMQFINSDYEQFAQVDILSNPEHALNDKARIYIYKRKDH